MKMYEINHALEDILNDFIFLEEDQVVDAETGEILEDDAASEVIAKVEALQIAREELLENLAVYVKELDGDAQLLKNEEKNLNARRHSLENKRDRIFNYLYETLNGEKISSPRVKVSYRKTQAVNVTDLSEIPDIYMRVKTVEEPDKVAIKDAFKSGYVVPGTEVVERLSMSIK